MIRFFALNAFIAIHTIFLCGWGFLVSLFDRKNGRLVHFYAAVPWAKTILWVCGVKVKTQGLENVNPERPCIFMTNHQSYFDILGLLACLPVDFKFMLKQELMRLPFLGFGMKKAGYIAIDREDPRKAVKSMNEAVRRIGNGASVLIFPEGTRSLDGRLQEFKAGGFHLALKAGCDIVPVVIVGSHRIVPKGSLKIRKGSFGLCVGKPIKTKDYSRKNMGALMQRVREAMIELTGTCEQ
ncbi:MAG: 1-acyl-sn-glycerol-3-phosphate acyltransferase [Deltaproteobacteria bacterium]|nr:1-acyl-sn-glycerol-3-phosphate acyltransferase [Deltaproteobacteria bacterium]MBW2045190.1 1-acyl-sn-glycerol-3-phosphate acyltransferase [Deltaproteobacteria bacterium]MBW2301111.1 1-acyl-sn-glycerol-3-phosphate acyltransferase [Deltaproteobacteria bacterium]